MNRPVTSTESKDTRQTYFYFGWLTLFVYLALPTGYLVDIQTSYMLKNQLHAAATDIATFGLITEKSACHCVVGLRNGCGPNY